MRCALALTALLILAGCSRAERTPYRIDMPGKEIMGHVVEPAAELDWDAAGYEITEAGEPEPFPTS